MRLIILLVITAIVVFPRSAAGQNEKGSNDYRNAIGIRAGRTSGLTFKHFFSSGNSMELIAGFWPNAVGLTGLYEKNMTAGVKWLRFYYGAGAHITAGTDAPYYRKHNQSDGPYSPRYGRRGFALGIDGVAGIEHKIAAIPLALSIDIKPFVEVSNYGVIYPAIDGSIGVKLAF